MKRLLLLPILLFTAMATAQDIKITAQGIEPVVVQADSITAMQMYDRVKTYVQKTYKNPDKVIKVDEPGKLLRFEGYKYYESGLYNSGNYFFSSQLEFKDGRYKITFVDVYFKSGTVDIPYTKIFNDKGEVRHYAAYKKQFEFFTDLLNGVNDAVKAAIMSKEKQW